MTHTDSVAEHYAPGALLKRISGGCAALNLTPPIDPDALAPVDEFHIGGRFATVPFMAALGLTSKDRVLDLGCGLGGPARYVAANTGAQVTGIDLTQEFVDTAQALTEWTGLEDRIDLIQGSILDLPLEAGTMDAAYMIHVGMNIADKTGLAREAARVLKPGGVFAIYDVMQVGMGDITFPVPWASSAEQSALASPDHYRSALTEAGFEITQQIDRTDFAKQFFADIAAAQRAAKGPPPLGLHLVMGDTTATKLRNMVENVRSGRISPIEIHARKRSA